MISGFASSLSPVSSARHAAKRSSPNSTSCHRSSGRCGKRNCASDSPLKTFSGTSNRHGWSEKPVPSALISASFTVQRRKKKVVPVPPRETCKRIAFAVAKNCFADGTKCVAHPANLDIHAEPRAVRPERDQTMFTAVTHVECRVTVPAIDLRKGFAVLRCPESQLVVPAFEACAQARPQRRPATRKLTPCPGNTKSLPSLALGFIEPGQCGPVV